MCSGDFKNFSASSLTFCESHDAGANCAKAILASFSLQKVCSPMASVKILADVFGELFGSQLTLRTEQRLSGFDHVVRLASGLNFEQERLRKRLVLLPLLDQLCLFTVAQSRRLCNVAS